MRLRFSMDGTVHLVSRIVHYEFTEYGFFCRFEH